MDVTALRGELLTLALEVLLLEHSHLQREGEGEEMEDEVKKGTFKVTGPIPRMQRCVPLHVSQFKGVLP